MKKIFHGKSFQAVHGLSVMPEVSFSCIFAPKVSSLLNMGTQLISWQMIILKFFAWTCVSSISCTFFPKTEFKRAKLLSTPHECDKNGHFKKLRSYAQLVKSIYCVAALNLTSLFFGSGQSTIVHGLNWGYIDSTWKWQCVSFLFVLNQ